MQERTERDLATCCAEGDAAGWSELIRRNERRMRLIFARVLGGAGDADLKDLLQELYVALLEHGGKALRTLRCEHEGALSSVLGQMALRLALDHLKSNRRRGGLGASAANEPTARRSTPEDAVFEAEWRTHLAQAILRVAGDGNPARDLVAVRAHLLDGLSVNDIAKLDLGLEPKGVETLLRRATERVRARIAPAMATPLVVRRLKG